MKYIFSSIVLFIMLLGCKSSQKAMDDSALVNAQWHLESSPELDPKAIELGINLTFFYNQGEKSVSGFSGCNRFMSRIQWDKNKMTFGEMTSTEMYCDGKMEAEKLFLQILKSVDSYTLDGQKLLLLKNKKALATFSNQTKNPKE